MVAHTHSNYNLYSKLYANECVNIEHPAIYTYRSYKLYTCLHLTKKYVPIQRTARSNVAHSFYMTCVKLLLKAFLDSLCMVPLVTFVTLCLYPIKIHYIFIMHVDVELYSHIPNDNVILILIRIVCTSLSVNLSQITGNEVIFHLIATS